MRMNYDDVVTYKEAWKAEETKARKWKRATLIIFGLLVISFTHGVWARARVIKKIDEYDAKADQLIERLASTVADARFRACVEELFPRPTEVEAKHLEFDLPESEWENSVVLHPDGTFRVWESKEGKIWGYGDIIEPK